MSAIPKDLKTRTSELNEASTRPFPGSRKVYVEGSRPDIRVPMRAVSQSETAALFGAEKNPDIYIYDTSGPYTDPDARIDLTRGLPALRAAWIAERDDTEELPGLSSEYGRARLDDSRLDGLRFDNSRKPLRAREGRNVSQMHSIAAIQSNELEDTRIQPGAPQQPRLDATHPDRSRHDERPGPMVPYIIAAVVAGLLVIGVLGLALSDVITVDEETGVSDSNLAGDPFDDTAGSDETSGPVEGVADAQTPVPTETPEATATPSPTSTPEPDPDPGEDPAAEQIAETLPELPGAASSAVVLPSGESFDEAGDREVPAASTIKLWIAATAYEEVSLGDLQLDDEHTIRAEDQAIGTGILNAGEYIGQTMTIDELIEIMLLHSDNSAANIIIEQIGGLERVNDYADDQGYSRTRMQRYLGDLDPDRENYTSAGDGALFVSRLIDDEIVDAETSERLRSILERRSANESAELDFFGRELPPGATYAHISGVLPGVRNEIGYFYNEHRDGYVIVSFMLGELADEAAAEDAIAETIAAIDALLSEEASG